MNVIRCVLAEDVNNSVRKMEVGEEVQQAENCKFQVNQWLEKHEKCCVQTTLSQGVRINPYWTKLYIGVDTILDAGVRRGAFGVDRGIRFSPIRGCCASGSDSRVRVRVSAFPSAPSEEERLKETLEQSARLSKQMEEQKATTKALRDEVATLEDEVC